MLQVPVPAANIEQQVVVNKKLQAYGLHLHFQRSELVTVSVQFYLTMISVNRFKHVSVSFRSVYFQLPWIELLKK